MERIEGFVESAEKDIRTGKQITKGFVIKDEVFEDIWGKNKRSIGFVNGDKAYDHDKNYLGIVIYYKKH